MYYVTVPGEYSCVANTDHMAHETAVGLADLAMTEIKRYPPQKPGVRKTVSVPAVMSAGTILAYIVAV